MVTTIIITEMKTPYGLCWVFNPKGSNLTVAEVDKFKGGYKVYSGEWLNEAGRRTKKDSAIEFAKRCVREQTGGEVEFKWNVMCQKVRFV